MKCNNSPIGIFDSGLGGLTVFREIRNILPGEDLIYFGDTARVPYGNKSKETVLRYSMEISEFLINKGVKIIVVACNTSSSLALEYLQKKAKVPIFGVIKPGAKRAVAISSGGNIAVIGTHATIKSRAYSIAIREEIKKLGTIERGRFKNYFKVTEESCPLLVPLVEEGFLNNNEITKRVTEGYLESIIKERPSCLVLGCTHYPILKNLISEVIGSDIQMIDSGIEAARAVKCFLNDNNMLRDSSVRGDERFFVSDDPGRFKTLGEKFLGFGIKTINVITCFL